MLIPYHHRKGHLDFPGTMKLQTKVQGLCIHSEMLVWWGTWSHDTHLDDLNGQKLGVEIVVKHNRGGGAVFNKVEELS